MFFAKIVLHQNRISNAIINFRFVFFYFFITKIKIIQNPYDGSSLIHFA